MVVATYEYDPPEAAEERRIAEADRRQSLSLQDLWKGDKNRRVSQRRTAIEIPEKEGTPVTVLTYHNGMTFYVFRESHDWEAAGRLTAWLATMLHTYDELEFVSLPASSMPEKGNVCFPVDTVRHLMNIHDEVVGSPLARRQGNRDYRRHGPGKRGK